MNPENEVNQLDLEFKKLEIQRIQLELSEMRRSWYLRPAFLSIFVPILAGIMTAVIGYLGNKEIENLQQEKTNLITEISEITKDLETLRNDFISSVSKFLELNEPIFAKGNPLYNLDELLQDKEKIKKYMQSGMEYYEVYFSSAILAIELKIKYIGEDKKDHEMINQLKDLKATLRKATKQSLEEIDSKSKPEVENN